MNALLLTYQECINVFNLTEYYPHSCRGEILIFALSTFSRVLLTQLSNSSETQIHRLVHDSGLSLSAAAVFLALRTTTDGPSSSEGLTIGCPNAPSVAQAVIE